MPLYILHNKMNRKKYVMYFFKTLHKITFICYELRISHNTIVELFLIEK